MFLSIFSLCLHLYDEWSAVSFVVFLLLIAPCFCTIFHLRFDKFSTLNAYDESISVYSGLQLVYFYNRFESNSVRHYDVPIDVNEEGVVMVYLNSTLVFSIINWLVDDLSGVKVRIFAFWEHMALSWLMLLRNPNTISRSLFFVRFLDLFHTQFVLLFFFILNGR